MSSEIKMHTFPFTKFGVINGEVINVSNDAIVDEERGLIYTMRVKMDNNTIMVNGREVKLMPGMSVTAEVQTGKRRIVEFFWRHCCGISRKGCGSGDSAFIYYDLSLIPTKISMYVISHKQLNTNIKIRSNLALFFKST